MQHYERDCASIKASIAEKQEASRRRCSGFRVNDHDASDLGFRIHGVGIWDLIRTHGVGV